MNIYEVETEVRYRIKTMVLAVNEAEAAGVVETFYRDNPAQLPPPADLPSPPYIKSRWARLEEKIP